MRISRSLRIAVSMAIPVYGIGSQEPQPGLVPQDPWAAQINAYTLRFAWNAVPGAGAYRISCGIGGRPERILGTMMGGAFVKYPGGVPLRVSYAMPLRPTTVSGEHHCFVEWGTVTGRFYGKTAFNPVTPVFGGSSKAAPAPAPASATATSASESEITLSWTPVPGATAYTINREVAPYGFTPFCDLCSAASTSIVDRFTEKSRKHRYFVTPITAAGAGMRATSNYVVPGVPPDTTPITPAASLTPPASITATVTSSTSAKASWIAVRGPVAYELQRYAGALKTPRIVRVPNDLPGVLIEYQDKLTLETNSGTMPVDVRYSIRSVDAASRFSEPVNSNTITVSTKEAQGGTIASRNVTNPTATTTSASSVMLTWTPPSGTYSCELQRSLSNAPFGLLTRLPAGAYRYVDQLTDLMTKAPRYRIRCGTGKLWFDMVSFPAPTPSA